MKKLKIIFFCLLGITLLSFKADETPIEKLLKQLVKLTENYPQEKVYLHFDKPYYAIGEDIWFKNYVVTAEKNEPSQLSKVLYVDFINQKNKIVSSLKLEVIDGFANGNINLADTLSSGTYRVRAYTNYMRNYNASFFFEKSIEIGSVSDKAATLADKAKRIELSLAFFPEGGHLVSSLRSRIGVKALTSNGLGANLTGYIVNKNNEKVAEFITEHAGMGVFAFTPLAGEKYTATVKLEDGSLKQFDMPQVQDNGYVFAVNQLEEEIKLRIAASAPLIDNKEIYVVAQSNGKPYASFPIKVDNSNITATLKSQTFPTGIVQFTLFDSNLNPAAERLIFVNHNDALNISITNNSSENIVKKKSSFKLAVSDFNKNPIVGNFSVSVIDMDKVPYNENDETTILSNLLLSSDLKGYIAQPNYYFNTQNPDRVKHLDNLLLTQGWRRFVWKDIITQTEPDITFRPEQSLEITGKVNNLNEKPLTNAKVSLISTTPGLFLKLDTITDVKGNFVFDRLEIPNEATFILQATDSKKNKSVKIRLNNLPPVLPYNFVNQEIDIKPFLDHTKKMFEELVKYNMLNGSILLKAVEIKSNRVERPLLNVPNSANASGAADQVITEKMLEGAINIYSPLLKTPGVIIKNGIVYRNRARTSIATPNRPMLLIVDGVQMPSDFISNINPMDVAGIEVLTSNYNLTVLGPDASGGALYITTKMGTPQAPEKATNTTRVSKFAFAVSKEFYVPNYDDPKTNTQLQDLRTTIYWNPKVLTNNKGEAEFSFFNAGTVGTYKITIEGMDNFGNLGRKYYTYQVK